MAGKKNNKKRKDADFNYRKSDQNPKGGMSKKGIERYNRETGSNLKPGVKGKADTPEKMKRKGSFLTRHYKGAHNMSHPLVDKKGEPTPKSRAARSWDEPAPKTKESQRKLVEKGERLLERAKKIEKREADKKKKAINKARKNKRKK